LKNKWLEHEVKKITIARPREKVFAPDGCGVVSVHWILFLEDTKAKGSCAAELLGKLALYLQGRVQSATLEVPKVIEHYLLKF
jgi:hypothetical protein